MMKDYEKFKETIAAKGALEALKERGVSISEDVIKDLPEDKTVAKLKAVKARIAPLVTDSHYVDVAYNEYLEKGGKQQEFRDGLKQFIRKEPKKVPLRKREIVNG